MHLHIYQLNASHTMPRTFYRLNNIVYIVFHNSKHLVQEQHKHTQDIRKVAVICEK